MIKAVLLDLDNTLIHNPDYGFAITYLRLLDAFGQQQWGQAGLAAALRQAMQRLKSPRRLDQNNAHIQAECMLQAGIAPTTQALHEGLRAFYAGAFQQLQGCIQPMAAAQPLIAALKERDYAVVIATNPVYSPDEVQQRMAWGGLNPDFSQYTFVTHSENMHAIKPDPAYYAEILARVGVEPDEAVMVGDSLENDIQPARSIGMMAYWVQAQAQAPTKAPNETNDNDNENTGTLAGFYEAITAQGWLEKQVPTPLKPEMIAPQMRGNVSALYGLLDGVPNHFWQQHPDPNEWSILQILCHLLETEASIQRARLERILQEDNPFLVQPPLPPGPQDYPCEGEDALEVAHQFTQERAQTLAFLELLHPQDWLRPARHSIFGPTNLLEMALFTAQHDRLHLNQLCQTIGNCQ